MTTALARRSDPTTSHEAAATVPISDLEAICLTAIRRDSVGLTSEELAAVTRLSLVTVSPRLRPMAKKGLIYDGGKRKNLSGRMAIVWCAVGGSQLGLW